MFVSWLLVLERRENILTFLVQGVPLIKHAIFMPHAIAIDAHRALRQVVSLVDDLVDTESWFRTQVQASIPVPQSISAQ